MIVYKKASLSDTQVISQLGKMLYSSDNITEKLKNEAEEHLLSGKWAIFLAFEEKLPIGLCEISLRSDYVEGTEGGIVGYIEGVFVLPEYRGRGIAKALIETGEDWARKQGCTEFASDCKLENSNSLNFHLKIGIEEDGRNIHFVKKL